MLSRSDAVDVECFGGNGGPGSSMKADVGRRAAESQDAPCSQPIPGCKGPGLVWDEQPARVWRFVAGTAVAGAVSLLFAVVFQLC